MPKISKRKATRISTNRTTTRSAPNRKPVTADDNDNIIPSQTLTPETTPSNNKKKSDKGSNSYSPDENGYSNRQHYKDGDALSTKASTEFTVKGEKAHGGSSKNDTTHAEYRSVKLEMNEASPLENEVNIDNRGKVLNDSNSNFIMKGDSRDPKNSTEKQSESSRKDKEEEPYGYHDDDESCISDGVTLDQQMSDDEGRNGEEKPENSTANTHTEDGNGTNTGSNTADKGKKCEYCGVVKRSPADLKRHLMKHTGERPFVCLLCDYARAFKAKRSLQYHQFSVHGVEHKNISERYPDIRKRKLEAGELVDESVILEMQKRGKFDEEECGYSSEGEGTPSAGGHIVNGLEPIKKRVCEICNKVCVKPSDLKRHMMSHTGERPFKCEVCGKPFRAKNSMMYHLKSSHGYNVELSPGLEERFLKLKKQKKGTTRVAKQAPFMTNQENFIKPSVGFPSYQLYGQPLPIPASLLGMMNLGQEKMEENGEKTKVYYSCDANSFPNGKAELDEASGLFKYDENEFESRPENLMPGKSNSEVSNSLAKPGGNLLGRTLVQESAKGTNFIHVNSETVLMTRVDGILPSGQEISMYKCYLCGKIYNHLSKIRHHLLFHFEKHITTYHCDLCNSSFWFKYQVVQHIRKKHAVELSNAFKEQAEIGREDCNTSATSVTDSHSPEIIQSDSGILSDDNQSEKSSDGSPNWKEKEGPMADKKQEKEGKTFTDKNAIATECINQFYHELTFNRNSSGKFVCMICKKSYEKEIKLLKHIKIHSNHNLYYCSICAEGFPNSGLLQGHMSKEHREMDLRKENMGKPTLSACIDNNTDSAGGMEVDSVKDAKRTLLSHLLKKTSELHQTDVSKENFEIPAFSKVDAGHLSRLAKGGSMIQKDGTVQASKGGSRNQREEHEAREYLEKAGLSDEVTVVMPCDPEEEQVEPENLSMPSVRRDTDNGKVEGTHSIPDMALDFSIKKEENGAEEELEPGEIVSAPKRTLLIKNKTSKSKRKSFQPTRIDRHDDSGIKGKCNGMEPATEFTKLREKNQTPQENNQKETAPERSSSRSSNNSTSPSQSATSPSTIPLIQSLPSFLTAPGLMAHFSAQAQAQLIASTQFVNTLASLGGQTPNLTSLAQALSNPAAQALISTGQYSAVIQALVTSGHLPSSLLAQAAMVGAPFSEKLSASARNLPGSSTANAHHKDTSASDISRGHTSPRSTESVTPQAKSPPSDHKNSDDITVSTPIGSTSTLTETSAPVSPSHAYSTASPSPAHSAFLLTKSPQLTPFMPGYFARLSNYGLPVSVHLPASDPQDVNRASTPPPKPLSPRPSSSGASEVSISGDASKMSDLSLKEEGRDNLVGYPRVQWSPKSDLIQWQHITPDGRKVTSLSRTHSRLPIVNAPVDRDQVCKALTLDDGRQVFRCPFCSKDFLSYSDINRHMDFHEDIRPYKCKYCEYYARTNSQLKVHMMRHQGIREFCCRVCNYKGVTQSDLNRHMKSQIHTLKSRNECKYCGEGFVTGKNLEKHLDGNCIVKVQQERGDLLV